MHLHQEHNTKSLGKRFLGFACFSLCGDSGNQHILRHSHDVNIVGSQNLLVLMESKALHIRFAERKKLCMIFLKKNAFVVYLSLWGHDLIKYRLERKWLKHC